VANALSLMALAPLAGALCAIPLPRTGCGYETTRNEKLPAS
jgi:hypothetical protein